jgi:hypothetical protein
MLLLMQYQTVIVSMKKLLLCFDLETWHESFDVATKGLSVDGRVIVHICFGCAIDTFKHLPINQ